MSRRDRLTWGAIGVFAVAAAVGAVVQWMTHQALRAAANRMGWQPDPVARDRLLTDLGNDKYFADAAAQPMAQFQPVDTFLYRHMDAASRAAYGRPFVVGKQLIGDCTSWGGAHAVYAAEAVDWSLGRLQHPPLFPCTEAMYGGSRVEARGRVGDGRHGPVGGWNDGSTGSAIAKWLRDWGVVYREKRDGLDLTTYDPTRAKNWGAYGCGGQNDDGKADRIASEHPVRHVSLVSTWYELAAAITSGYPVTVASSQGFATRTDSSGVCEPAGIWMHQMVIIGIRFARNSPPNVRAIDAALVLNSWGPNWITYGGRYPADQLAGSFWVERRVIEQMLAAGDSWAIGRVQGWTFDKINHDWLENQK